MGHLFCFLKTIVVKKQHLPKQRTDEYPNAESGRAFITRTVYWQGRCGTQCSNQ